MTRSADFLVIGSGIAGLWFALQASAHGKVVVVTKDRPEESNTRYAQGGIAAVWTKEDSFDDHVRDTMVAGAGLCRRVAVETTVREGPARVRDLIEVGARFTRKGQDPDHYDLHREGGHSHRRILHTADFTGTEIMRALRVAAAERGITILDHHMAVDLITESWLARQDGHIPPPSDRIHGAYVLDTRTQQVQATSARVVALATGGAGKTYLYTTNPRIATGDGIAMAWRSGARVANMEFVQFHPTCLFHPKETSFLISEALRGEGGTLLLPSGERFMPRYDERAELAPRDIVARAIDAEMKRHGLDHVCLDMTHLSREQCEHRFPSIYAKLQSLDIDMVTQPIPVVPAAHYFCGGVHTDLHGETSITNLFAAGETACTGLHGANRLASNSLLEALVFSQRAADLAGERLADISPPLPLPEWEEGHATDPDEQVVIHQVWREIRRFMANYVGIVRTYRRLKRAHRRVKLVQEEIEQYYWDFRITDELIELRNLAQVAELVVMSALKRQESRGLHYTKEFPDPDPRFIHDTMLQRLPW